MKHFYLLFTFCALLFSCSTEPVEDSEKDPDPDPEGGLEACFELSDTVLAIGQDLEITNCSEGAITYLYDFGNGETSTDEHPETDFEEGGQYTITLTVTNELEETDTFTKQVTVLDAESFYIYPTIPDGFSSIPLELSIHPISGNIYYIENLEDEEGPGGTKFYYKELNEDYTLTSNYLADKPHESNSAFVNFYPSGNMNFVFARTLVSLYGTQEVTYASDWGFVNAQSSAAKHNYGVLRDGSNWYYYGSAEDGGIYKAAVETRNSSGDAFEVSLNAFGPADSMIGDMVVKENEYIAFGAVFSKNDTDPRLTDYKPLLIFFDENFTVTSHVIYNESVLDMELSSANDLNGSYHLEKLANGNFAMYANGELIVADNDGDLINRVFFENTSNNQALMALEDSFVLSSDGFIRKFDNNGNELKQLAYAGKHMPEIIEWDNELFFVAGYEIDGKIQLLYGACDDELNLVPIDFDDTVQ